MKNCQQVLASYETQVQSLSTTTPSPPQGDQKLEDRLSTLEQFASRLEQGSFTLEETFSQYQQSIALVHECTHLLSVYEQEAIALSKQAQNVATGALYG